jgi:hypothetical protein
MILCEECAPAEHKPNSVNVFGVLSNIDSLDDSPFPLLYPRFCIFLALTEGRGEGSARIRCMFEETRQTVFATPVRRIQFGADPLAVSAFAFRVRDCPFPRPGIYLVQFWYNGEKLEERPLRLR